MFKKELLTTFIDSRVTRSGCPVRSLATETGNPGKLPVRRRELSPGYKLTRLKLVVHVGGHLLGFGLLHCHGSLLQLGGQSGYIPRLNK